MVPKAALARFWLNLWDTDFCMSRQYQEVRILIQNPVGYHFLEEKAISKALARFWFRTPWDTTFSEKKMISGSSAGKPMRYHLFV